MVRRGLALAACCALAGCGGPPAAAPDDTGARAAVLAYYDGLIRQDWPAMYGLLHPDAQRRLSPERFEAAAKATRRKVGFVPEEVHVRSCEEHGADAVAHVVLSTKAAPHRRRYSDGLTARRVDGAWRIDLPDNYGR